ncbi:MAG: hypothetical protein KTR16_11395 [Acidiferrobacterales bacterium]|nr:hypothetical protein [Acidiferrobacterales bacterium]
MSKLKHITEHDGSRWVELEVAEEMYDLLELIKACEITSNIANGWSKEINELLTKARGESK